MRFSRVVVIAAVFSISVPSLSSRPAVADESPSKESKVLEGQQQACELNGAVKVDLKYWLYLPEGYQQQESWPLMLFLHGAGERGDDLQLVRKHGPPKLVGEGKQFPFIIVSPQCPSGRWWQPMELATLLDEIVDRYRVDQDRIVVTGLSMGGYGTWDLAAYQPDRFAALAPICGGSDPIRAKYLAGIPVWVFHGRKDSVVPVERSEAMVEALKKADSPVKFTVYDEANHDSWTETYANPKLYEWLLQQKRSAR
jgi:predicted peptidase